MFVESILLVLLVLICCSAVESIASDCEHQSGEPLCVSCGFVMMMMQIIDSHIHDNIDNEIGKPVELKSRLQLVDLAGSECVGLSRVL